jgi:hypothetical protein
VDPRAARSHLVGPGDPCVYLTWLIRPARDGCTIRLEIDEAGHPDSREDAEDAWLPVLGALQQVVNPLMGADDDLPGPPSVVQ